METGDEDYVYILDTLEKGKEHIEELKQENDKLRQANTKLVQLVEKLETIIEEEVDSFDWSATEYDYPHQWSPSDVAHEKRLDQDRVQEVEDFDAQISEAIKSLKRAQKFKSE